MVIVQIRRLAVNCDIENHVSRDRSVSSHGSILIGHGIISTPTALWSKALERGRRQRPEQKCVSPPLIDCGCSDAEFVPVVAKVLHKIDGVPERHGSKCYITGMPKPKQKTSPEFQRFEQALRHVLSVPKDVVMAEIERQHKPREKRKSKASASRRASRGKD